MKEIPLTRMKFALVDDEDYEELIKHKWYYMTVGYAARYSSRANGNKKRCIYMHRQLLGAMPKQEVDHVNHNKLDNRRENIRLATSRQNKCNRVLGPTNKSGFKGVSWVKRRRKWGVQVRVGVGQPKWIGYFDDKQVAYTAYCKAACRLYGEFASL